MAMAANRLAVKRGGTSLVSSRTGGSSGMVLDYVNCALKNPVKNSIEYEG